VSVFDSDIFCLETRVIRAELCFGGRFVSQAYTLSNDSAGVDGTARPSSRGREEPVAGGGPPALECAASPPCTHCPPSRQIMRSTWCRRPCTVPLVPRRPC